MRSGLQVRDGTVGGAVDPARVANIEDPDAVESRQPLDLLCREDRERDEHQRDNDGKYDACPPRNENREGDERADGECVDELQRPDRGPLGEPPERDQAERVERRFLHGEPSNRQEQGRDGDRERAELDPRARPRRAACDPEPEHEHQRRHDRLQVPQRDVAYPPRGEGPDLERETRRPGGCGRDERAGGGVANSPGGALDRHRDERDERDSGDEDEDAARVPEHVFRHRADLIAAAGRGVRAEGVVPATGDRVARKRDGAHGRHACEEDGLASCGAERPFEAALDCDCDEQARDERDQPDVRRQREHDRARDESLPSE